ncbi:MAG: cytochrome c maturation protein CcmE [Desulfovibrio sp.]|jgi:cytochrome c-type biogenesis protein CcmE|nr:cytochrome c maturation protein CcmE [Desulfovibrio sp.]
MPPVNSPLQPDKEGLSPRCRGRGLYAAALLLFLAGVGCLVAVGAVENGVYCRNVSEILDLPRDHLKAIRIFGTVKGEGLARIPEGPGVRFQLEDAEDAARTLWVVYRGVVPDAFQAGAEVLIEGGFEATGPDFRARTLMTKCPSKYQKENRG